jgi:eukaryotic-like serine/threonine-protein kinase
VRIPYALMRWKISKAGFEAFEGAPFGTGPLGWLGSGFRLRKEGESPEGTVWVPGGRVVADIALSVLPPATVADYYLDRFEVTNRQYRAFVSAGGYSKREFWEQPFVDGGRELSWEEAMDRLRDATGRPGPAGWELGTYPDPTGTKARERRRVPGLPAAVRL